MSVGSRVLFAELAEGVYEQGDPVAKEANRLFFPFLFTPPSSSLRQRFLPHALRLRLSASLRLSPEHAARIPFKA